MGSWKGCCFCLAMSSSKALWKTNKNILSRLIHMISCWFSFVFSAPICSDKEIWDRVKDYTLPVKSHIVFKITYCLCEKYHALLTSREVTKETKDDLFSINDGVQYS